MLEEPLGGAPAEPGAVVDLPHPGRYGLAGRESELGELERAFQRSHIVLLTGPAGIGKSELACGVARRLAQEGERPGGVLFTSFSYGAGLCRVLHEMGTTLRGVDFARLPLEEQRVWLVGYLAENPCLLVWDGFDDAFEFLDPREIEELVRFLTDVGVGPSRILVTGRETHRMTDAGVGYQHVELGGLEAGEARRLAEMVLEEAAVEAGHPAGRQELIELLGRNPMAMRLVLPHLKVHLPGELSRALQELSRTGLGDTEPVEAALECSFSRLSPRTQAHLPFLSLFRERVILDVLTFITQGETYASVMGEEMGWGACRTYLREARDFGFLDSVSPSVYIIPRSARGYLHKALLRRIKPLDLGRLEEEFARVYADLGDYFLEQLSSENSESTITGVSAEEANLLRALALAESWGRWEYVQVILQPLAQVYRMQERVLELRRLREHLMDTVGHEAARAVERGAIDLWMYLQGTEVSDAIDRVELDKAEGICQVVLEYLGSLGDAGQGPQAASMYYGLGSVAQRRGEYERASGWYHKSLEIAERLDAEAECADSYHQLGLMAQSLEDWEEAERRHRVALEIRERLGDEVEVAAECHQLGLVAESRDEFDDALEWYHKARMTCESVGDSAGAAAVYHRLGLMAQTQYQYEEAVEWYQRALLTYDEIGDAVGGADDCYQLGVMALYRDEHEEAEEWLNRALDAYRHLGNDAAGGNASHHLGVVAHAQGRHEEAEALYQSALEVFVRLGDEIAAASTWGQMGLLADQRGNYPHAVWYVAHTYEIAAAHQLPLLQQATSHLADLRSKMGTEGFITCWQEISSTDILSELEKGP